MTKLNTIGTPSNADAHQRNHILIGDVRQKLNEIDGSSIDTIITSPPYFRLRNYQIDQQIGLESHVDAFVDELRLVARGLFRVLKPTGSLWLNLGDTYAQTDADGATKKNLLLVPERVALALQADGWILRNKIVWAKPNPMPSSVKDRLACTYEVVYFFSKSRNYFFDLDAIRVPHKGIAAQGKKATRRAEKTRSKAWSVPDSWRGPSSGSNSGLDRLKATGLVGHPLGKNPGDVWTIPTAGYRGAHHAVFPPKLVERPLLASCPEKVCEHCGTPWARSKKQLALLNSQKGQCVDEVSDGLHRKPRPTLVRSLSKLCKCESFETRPGVVLDPFFGSGTTGLVAERHRRDWIGIELNPGFAELASKRIGSPRCGDTNKKFGTAA
jgi:site-specific DNA-methyltransferase (adenine-specific)